MAKKRTNYQQGGPVGDAAAAVIGPAVGTQIGDKGGGGMYVGLNDEELNSGGGGFYFGPSQSGKQAPPVSKGRGGRGAPPAPPPPSQKGGIGGGLRRPGGKSPFDIPTYCKGGKVISTRSW